MKPQIVTDRHRSSKFNPCLSVFICGFLKIILPGCLNDEGEAINAEFIVQRSLLRVFRQLFADADFVEIAFAVAPIFDDLHEKL